MRAPATERKSLLSPGMLGLHLLAIVLVAAMVLLGWWQSDRYAASRAAATAQAEAAAVNAAPVPLGSVVSADSAFPSDKVGAKVVVLGRYATARQQFLVRGHRHDGRRGYWVLTPLRVGRSALLVVRGWAATPNQPAVRSVPKGPVRVVGWLEPPEATATSAVSPPDRGRIVDAVHTASLVAQVPYDLYSAYVVLAEQSPPPAKGLAIVDRPAAPVSSASGWRNLTYAAQWWVFAAFVTFMWWRIVRDARVA